MVEFVVFGSTSEANFSGNFCAVGCALTIFVGDFNPAGAYTVETPFALTRGGRIWLGNGDEVDVVAFELMESCVVIFGAIGNFSTEEMTSLCLVVGCFGTCADGIDDVG